LGNYESRDLRGDRPSARGYSSGSSPSRCRPSEDNVSEGVLGHRTAENLPTQNPSDWFVETEHFLVL
jgi:hypothetical protein